MHLAMKLGFLPAVHYLRERGGGISCFDVSRAVDCLRYAHEKGSTECRKNVRANTLIWAAERGITLSEEKYSFNRNAIATPGMRGMQQHVRMMFKVLP